MKYKNIINWLIGIVILLILNTKFYAFTHNWDLGWIILHDYPLTIWLFNSSLNWFLVLALLIWSLPFIKKDNYKK